MRGLIGLKTGRSGCGQCWGWSHHRRVLLLGRRLDADMLGIEALLTRHHCPKDSGVLVGHGHAGFLPAHPLNELFEPAAGGVVALVHTHDGGLGTLDQQRAQIVVAALGDTPQAGLAAGGVLARHDAQPGTKLPAGLELIEVSHRGGERRGTELPDRSVSMTLLHMAELI